MKILTLSVIAAAALAAALPAQAQNWYTTPSTWYIGAAGGPGRIDLNCGAGNCDRTGTAWKVYGGFQFPNNTGAELVYYDAGQATGDVLDAIDVAPGKLKGNYTALAGTWSPPLGAGFVANVKLGISVSDGKVTGTFDGADYSQDRTRFPHLYAAGGLGWKLNPHIEFTADYDYSRISYRSADAKQTVDAGGFTFGAQYLF